MISLRFSSYRLYYDIFIVFFDTPKKIQKLLLLLNNHNSFVRFLRFIVHFFQLLGLFTKSLGNCPNC